MTFFLIASSWVELTVVFSIGAWLGLPTLRIEGVCGNVVGGGTVAAGGNPGGTRTGGSTLRIAAGGSNEAGIGLRFVKSSDRLSSTVASLSVRGAKGDPDDGFLRAFTMLRAPAMIKSIDDARSMVTLVGNHWSVSAMRSRRVSQI